MRQEPRELAHRKPSYSDNTDRKFITVGRAAQEYLLKPSHLEGLPKYSRRSPYESEVSITVYNRKDVLKRALEVWGSLETLEKEKQNREYYRQFVAQSNYESKKNLREARRKDSRSADNEEARICGNREVYLVALAITIDGLNVIFKLVAYLLTGSESLLAETIHSTADTLNQSILLVGLYQMAQKANDRHPYGYSNTMYVASLISGVGIFCLGSAVSTFRGIMVAISETNELKYKDIVWAFVVLGFSFCTEGICLLCTVRSGRKSARKLKVKFFYYEGGVLPDVPPKIYVLHAATIGLVVRSVSPLMPLLTVCLSTSLIAGRFIYPNLARRFQNKLVFRGTEPGVVAIFLEDFAAVVGNVIAAVTLGISWKTSCYLPDAIGCVLIGILLGAVALFLIVTNSTALVGRSIREDRLEDINWLVESDVMVRALYDVKGIDIGNNLVRYKAELDFDGAQLTRLYLDRIDLNNLLNEIKGIENIDDLQEFMVTHGENIVDLLGGEIDRIELKVRSRFPEVRHLDLEIV